MDILTYLLFFWCLYLTFQVRKLKEHISDKKEPPETPCVVTPITQVVYNPPDEPHGIHPRELSFLSQLLQKLPRYETTTWIGVFFSIIGAIGGYQYVVEQGWYTPSLIGSYSGLSLFILGGYFFARRQINPQTSSLLESITYLFAGAGFFWISHQFNTYDVWHALVLNIGLLVTTLRFRHSDFERFHLWGLFSVSLLLCWYASTTPWVPLITLGRMVYRRYPITLPLFIVLLEAITALSSSIGGSTIAIGAFISIAWGIILYDLLVRHNGHLTVNDCLAPISMAAGFMASLIVTQPTIPFWILSSFVLPHLILPYITPYSRVIHLFVAGISALLYIALGAYWLDGEVAPIVSGVSSTLLLIHLLGERIRPFLLIGWSLAIINILLGYVGFDQHHTVLLSTAGILVWFLGTPYPKSHLIIAFTPAFPILLRSPIFSDIWTRSLFFAYSIFLIVIGSASSWITLFLFALVAITEGSRLRLQSWYYWIALCLAYGYDTQWYSLDVTLFSIIVVFSMMMLKMNSLPLLLPIGLIIHGYLWSSVPFYRAADIDLLNLVYVGIAVSFAFFVWLRRYTFNMVYALPLSFFLATTLYWVNSSITPWGFLATLYAIAYLKEYAHIPTIWNKGLLLIAAKTLFMDGLDISPLYHYGECFIVGIVLILLARQRRA